MSMSQVVQVDVNCISAGVGPWVFFLSGPCDRVRSTLDLHSTLYVPPACRVVCTLPFKYHSPHTTQSLK